MLFRTVFATKPRPLDARNVAKSVAHAAGLFINSWKRRRATGCFGADTLVTGSNSRCTIVCGLARTMAVSPVSIWTQKTSHHDRGC